MGSIDAERQQEEEDELLSSECVVVEGTIYGSSKNLSNQGSLKNHFLKEFFGEPIKVSQRTFKTWFFKAPFMVPQRTFQTRVL